MQLERDWITVGATECFVSERGHCRLLVPIGLLFVLFDLITRGISAMRVKDCGDVGSRKLLLQKFDFALQDSLLGSVTNVHVTDDFCMSRIGANGRNRCQILETRDFGLECFASPFYVLELLCQTLFFTMASRISIASFTPDLVNGAYGILELVSREIALA